MSSPVPSVCHGVAPNLQCLSELKPFSLRLANRPALFFSHCSLLHQTTSFFALKHHSSLFASGKLTPKISLQEPIFFLNSICLSPMERGDLHHISTSIFLNKHIIVKQNCKSQSRLILEKGRYLPTFVSRLNKKGNVT